MHPDVPSAAGDSAGGPLDDKAYCGRRAAGGTSGIDLIRLQVDGAVTARRAVFGRRP
jgi:hypothetical protein